MDQQQGPESIRSIGRCEEQHQLYLKLVTGEQGQARVLFPDCWRNPVTLALRSVAEGRIQGICYSINGTSYEFCGSRDLFADRHRLWLNIAKNVLNVELRNRGRELLIKHNEELNDVQVQVDDAELKEALGLDHDHEQPQYSIRIPNQKTEQKMRLLNIYCQEIVPQYAYGDIQPLLDSCAMTSLYYETRSALRVKPIKQMTHLSSLHFIFVTGQGDSSHFLRPHTELFLHLTLWTNTGIRHHRTLATLPSAPVERLEMS